MSKYKPLILHIPASAFRGIMKIKGKREET